MRHVALTLIAMGIVLLGIAHFPSLRSSDQANSGIGEGVGDCGVVALALICHAENDPHPLGEIRQLAHCTSQGTSLLNLKKAAESLGYTALGVSLGFESLHEHVSKPHHFAILHIVPDHFIAVLGAADEGHVRTAGLGKSSTDSDKDELRELGWEGVALLIHSAPEKKMLEMDPSSIDLGRISVGSIANFSAAIKNRSAEKVVIEEIKANCGCANLPVEQTSLQALTKPRF